MENERSFPRRFAVQLYIMHIMRKVPQARAAPRSAQFLPCDRRRRGIGVRECGLREIGSERSGLASNGFDRVRIAACSRRRSPLVVTAIRGTGSPSCALRRPRRPLPGLDRWPARDPGARPAPPCACSGRLSDHEPGSGTPGRVPQRRQLSGHPRLRLIWMQLGPPAVRRPGRADAGGLEAAGVE